MTWTACYAPDRNVTQSGFATEEEAWAYVHDHMCKTCTEAFLAHQNGVELKEDDWDWGACEVQWFVMLTSEYLED